MLKGLAWLVSAILAVLLGGMSVLLLSDRAFFALVDRVIPTITPYRITLENPRIHWREGRLEIATLQVHQPGSDGPPLLGVEELSISGDPMQLLQRGISRSDVSTAAVVVYVNATDASEDPDPAEWLQYTALFPRTLVIGTMHVVSQDTVVNVLPLSDLYGGWQDKSHFVASAGADYAGTPLVFALSVERQAVSANSSSLAMHGVLKPQEGSSRIELDGELTATDESVNYQFDLHADYERVQDFLGAIEQDAYPFEGTLTLDGTLAGNLEHYELAVRQLELDNGDDYRFTASGTLTRTQQDATRLDVSARGRMASVERLFEIAEINAGEIGEATAELHLTGPLTRPVLEEFAVETRNRDGLELTLTPRAGQFELRQRQLLPGQELAVSLSAPTLRAVQPWVGTLPIDPGAWALQFTLSRLHDAFRMEDVSFVLGSPATVELSLDGNIDSLRLTPVRPPEISGIRLALEGRSDNVQSLLRAFGAERTDIPSLSTARLSAQLRGTMSSLRIEDARLALAAENLLLSADALSAELHPRAERPLQRLEGNLELSLASTDPLAGLNLPAPVTLLDSVQVDSRVVFRPGTLSASDIVASAQTLDGVLRAQGSIDNILKVKGLSLDVSLQALPLSQLAAVFQDDEPVAFTEALPGLLSGSARVSGHRDSITVERIDLSLMGGEAAGATLQGRAGLRDGVPTAQIEVAYRLDDRDLIESLTGQRLAPGSGSIVLDYRPGQLVVALRSLMGDSDIAAVLNATRDQGEISGLDLDINVPRLYLPDILGAPEAVNLNGARPQDRWDRAKPDSTLTWRDLLPAYPVHLEANIGEIVGDNTAINAFTFRISGSDQRYTLEHFDLDYAAGSAAFRGVADLSSEQVGVSLAGSADAVPLTAIAADLGYEGDIEGTLSILTGMTARGDSVPALVQSLSGRLAAAVADGHIEGAAYDLLATDLLGWLLRGGLLHDATDFHCAALNFNLRGGRAVSDRLYVLTRNMIASGNATIDLAEQRLELRLQPRARKRSVQMPSSISVRGALDNPRISISPIAATMDTTAKILFFVPELLLRLFGLGPNAEGRVESCTVDG